MIHFNQESSGNIVSPVLFISSWWALEFCHTTATSCILTAWWQWRRTVLMQTHSSMANEWLKQRCCVRAPHSSLVLHTSLSLWTRCMTKGEGRSQGPWWEADTSLGESERRLSVYWVASHYFFTFTYYHPSVFPLSSPLLPLYSFSTHFQKCVHKKSTVCYCRWKRDRMRFEVGRQKERWRKGTREWSMGLVRWREWGKWEEREWRSFEVMAGWMPFKLMA